MRRFQYLTNDVRRRRRIKDKKVIIYRREGGLLHPMHPGKLWAYYRQLSGDEIHRAKQDQREEDVQFVVNWRPDYADWDFIFYRGTFYNVTRVDDYEGYKKDLTVYADNIQVQPSPDEVMEWA